MAEKKKKLSPWARILQARDAFVPPIEPVHPTATPGMIEVAEWARGQKAPAPEKPDLTLTGDLASDSAYQQNARKASEIMFKGAEATPDEKAFLQAWQNRPIGQ